jgi:hypothetical protein
MSQANGVIASVGGVSHAPLMARIGFGSKSPTAYRLFTERHRRYRTRRARQSLRPEQDVAGCFKRGVSRAQHLSPRLAGGVAQHPPPRLAGGGLGGSCEPRRLRSPGALLIALPRRARRLFDLVRGASAV